MSDLPQSFTAPAISEKHFKKSNQHDNPGLHYSIYDKEVRIHWVKHILGEDGKLERIKPINIINFPIFYKINAEYYVLDDKKRKGEFYFIQTNRGTEELLSKEELNVHLIRLLKESVALPSASRLPADYLEIKDFISYYDSESNTLLEDLYVEEQRWTTHYGYFDNHHVTPNEYDLIRLKTAQNKENFIKIDWKSCSGSEFYSRTYSKENVEKAKKILSIAPRTEMEKVAYKIAFCWSLAGYYYNLIDYPLYLFSISKITGVGKSKFLKFTVGNFWGTTNVISNQFFTKFNPRTELKDVLPDSRPKFNDEISGMGKETKEMLKVRLEKSSSSFKIPFVSTGHTNNGSYYFPQPYLNSATSNDFDTEQISDFADKFVNFAFKDIDLLKNKNELARKSQLSEADVDALEKTFIQDLGIYTFKEIFLQNNPNEVLNMIKKKYNPHSRMEKQFVFLKFGEWYLNKLGLFEDVNLTLDDLKLLFEENMNEIYSEADEIKETITFMITGFENRKGMQIPEFVKKLRSSDITYQDFRFYKDLNNLGISLKVIGNDVYLLVQEKGFISNLNLVYRNLFRRNLNMKDLQNLTFIMSKAFGMGLKYQAHKNVIKLSHEKQFTTPSMIVKKGIAINLKEFKDDDDIEDIFFGDSIEYKREKKARLLEELSELDRELHYVEASSTNFISNTDVESNRFKIQLTSEKVENKKTMLSLLQTLISQGKPLTLENIEKLQPQYNIQKSALKDTLSKLKEDGAIGEHRKGQYILCEGVYVS